MNFSLLKVDNPNKLKSLSKNKINFFKKVEVEDVSLFHFNKIDNDFYHAVFNISDEYQVSTKKLGSQHNYMYSSLINFFFVKNSKYTFLEFINSEYEKEVLLEIKNRAKVEINKYELNNEDILSILNKLNGDIKKLKYITRDEEYKDLDFVSKNDFFKISQFEVIEEVTILLENQFITITNRGKISVDNSNEEFLIKFTKRILNAMD